MIEQTTLGFLKNLEQNNNREWFNANRNQYESAKNNYINFCSELLQKLKTIQTNLLHTETKDCVFRINRDIRFSKDKSPYKNYLSAGFGPGGRKSGKIDFYFHLQNNETFLGGGMWQPSPEHLFKYRQELDYNPEKLKTIIFSNSFKVGFPIISGEKLKTIPKNYKADHPEIELLKFKELFFMKKFSNVETMNPNFIENLFKHCLILKPYLDYLNELFYES